MTTILHRALVVCAFLTFAAITFHVPVALPVDVWGLACVFWVGSQIVLWDWHGREG